MKIHILCEFVEGPWGGGNQFLKALRRYLRKKGVYSRMGWVTKAMVRGIC